MYDPIAYVYEADYHCEDCAEKRFGRSSEGFIAEDATDSEGNPVGIVSPWGEWWEPSEGCQTLACGTCRALIATVHKEGCENDLGEDACDLKPENIA